MALSELLRDWRSHTDFSANVAAWRCIPERPTRSVPFPPDLNPALCRALRETGIQALYSHQAKVWEAAMAGRHVVVVTGTASGKTLCYNLPVLHHLINHPEGRALYLFPTKALAQDQADQLLRLAACLPPDHDLPRVFVSAYDGDTPPQARTGIRTNARVVISNPDMLHAGVLPHHTLWADFFRHLRFVVIDEIHAYRGVFGSHVANVLRRMKRVAAFYGSSPQFVLTSATIANPGALAGHLVEEPVELVDDDGSGRGERHFLIYNPPILNRDLGLRRSALLESVDLARDLLGHDVQTIVFGRSRRTVELVLSYLRRGLDLLGRPVGAQDLVRAYRSGYLPAQRREIERGLRSGRVRTVVATSALELGVDIGGMGAAVLVGYPGTIAGTWQQAGRAGRHLEPSVAVMVSTSNPLDQYLAHHPDYFFGRSPEQALVNPDHVLILLQHIRCAAFELPFRAGEDFGRVGAGRVEEYLKFLEGSGEIHQSGGRSFWMADRYPAEAVSLRSSSTEAVLLRSEEDEGSETIGQVDRGSASWMVHPGAVYLHEGRTYIVEHLDLEQNVARLRPAETDYYTEPSSHTTVALLDKSREARVTGAIKAYGEISVTAQVVGFHRIKWFTHERLSSGEVDLPPSELHTTGYWLGLSEEAVDGLRAEGLWRDDPNDYGPNWPIQRDRTRARDGFVCQNCGAPETGRAHDVHHGIPFRAFPTHEQANRLENLVTLCQACHRRAESAVRIRSGLAGLAFAVGHLAPLLLMCDAHDLGVHFDPQSSLTGGRPTLVTYDLVPAGIGFSERLFERHDELIEGAFEMVSACDCADGCPSCVGPGGEGGQGGKRETRAILESLIPHGD